jgi:uncharacterized protein YlzI (FlbEa/FlbD family)
MNRFIELEDTRNVSIYVDPDHIILITPQTADTADISLSNGITMRVKQHVDVVMQRIEEHHEPLNPLPPDCEPRHPIDRRQR